MSDVDQNPFSSPGEVKEEVIAKSSSRGWQCLAYCLLLAPIPFRAGFRWWAINYAPGWLVSDRLPPEQRLALLGGTVSTVHAIAFTIVMHFCAFLIFYRLRKYPYVTGTITILYGLLLLPALFVFWLFWLR
jgi:hypothetical protein